MDSTTRAMLLAPSKLASVKLLQLSDFIEECAMTQTVTALYDTYDSAASAVNALEASGIPHSDISIVSNNVDNRYAKDRPTNAAEDAG